MKNPIITNYLKNLTLFIFIPHPAQWCPSKNVEFEGSETIVNAGHAIHCVKKVLQKPYKPNFF